LFALDLIGVSYIGNKNPFSCVIHPVKYRICFNDNTKNLSVIITVCEIRITKRVVSNLTCLVEESGAFPFDSFNQKLSAAFADKNIIFPLLSQRLTKILL